MSHKTLSIKQTAMKLHRQFAHPPPERLLKLVNSAGSTWSSNQELKEEIQKLHKECHICQIYKRPPPRPITCLPIATKFQECVAMDLKFYNKHIILHMIDYATRLSASTIIRSKQPNDIHSFYFISNLFLGLPARFLAKK